MKTSITRIVHPSVVSFSLIPFIILLIAMPSKIWLSSFNKNLSEEINSETLKATSVDALNDVFILAGASFSLLFSKFSNIPVDGYIGVLIAIFIMYSAYRLAKETLNPILGEAADPDFVMEIINRLKEYEYISGVHDLIVHNYGPTRIMVSVHAEVPCDISISKIHEIIDKVEKDIYEAMGVYIIIHTDPINTDNEEVARIREDIINILKSYKEVKSFHDFRVVGTETYKNLVFDVVLKSNSDFSIKGQRALKAFIDTDVKALGPNYNSVITFDRDFTSKSKN
ncbi:MAG TPA: cation transporter dimerization domain-containing protein [Clostridiaceae bacterium]